MNNTQHTPTPWYLEDRYTRVSDYRYRSEIRTQQGTTDERRGIAIVEFPDEPEGEEQAMPQYRANAAFIVLAANNHDALVDFVDTVASGNTEYERLEEFAIELLTKIRKERGR